MRTLTRRGFVAGAMTVLAPLSIGASARAAEPNIPEETGTDQRVPDLTSLPTDLDAAATSVPTSGQGQALVDFAMLYLGYPYAAGGNGPGGFDCSGFTQFVVLNVLGVDIGHAVEGQPAAGAWVDYNAWQPGDIVFFQNTYRAGISHASIYIGDGQIIHAENEATGVTISSLWSDYYAPRYWGAIRLV